MANNRLGFDQFCRKVEKSGGEIDLILDTNVIIANFDEDHRQYDIVREFIKRLEQICMGYSDAMILNVFTASTIPYLVTLDYDLVYGATINAKGKFVLTPDKRLSEYKENLRRAPEITALPRSKPKPN